MSNKIWMIWEKTRIWCLEHPNEKAMIPTVDGGWIVTWQPHPTAQQRTIDQKAEKASK